MKLSRLSITILVVILISLSSCSHLIRTPETRNPPSYPWRIEVKSPPRWRGAAESVRKQADTLMRKAADFIGHDPTGPYIIYLTSNSEEFNRYAGANAPEWAVAIYDSDRRAIVLRPEGFKTDPQYFYNILQHELVHAALDHEFRNHPGSLPRWLNEGIAVYLSDAWEAPQAWTIRKAALHRDLKDGQALSFGDIESGFPHDESIAQLAYTQSYDMVQYTVRAGGEKRFRRLLAELAAGSSPDTAFEAVYKKTFDEHVADWQNAVRAPGPVLWFTFFIASIDTWIWALLAVLAIIGAFRIHGRIRRRTSPDMALDYDPEDDWDELDEEWDPDLYGNRPWRPGGKNQSG
jgi:hypothetical protein